MVDRLFFSNPRAPTVGTLVKSPFFFSSLSLSLSLSPFILFLFFFSFLPFFSFLIHRTSFSTCLFISHFSFHFPFSLFLSFSHLFICFFYFLLLLASPTHMDQVGETSPHFPPRQLVITMFFVLIFFFPFITSCNTWPNLSHLFQVHHMDLSMCHSLGVPCDIHMIMPCVTRHPVPRKNIKFQLSRNPTKFNWVIRFRDRNSTAKSVSSSKI